ncbi:MAG: dephospho-CoA kinase [Acidimicrobiales bacterium]|jgi:dephospho-CoA kinase
MIIGITGTDGAGKGAVVDYLVKEKGFVHYSARAIWEAEFVKRGIESSRANMRLVANEMRASRGHDFLITYYLAKKETDGIENAVIESIRATAEADTLKANGGVLLAADADQSIRYERITARGSSSDNVSLAEFTKHEALEMNDPDPSGMQKAKVMEMADHTIMNEGTFEELGAQIEEVLEKIGSEDD